MDPVADEVGSGEGPLARSWRLNPLIELRWHDWGDDSVVHEARSGQLFQLDALSAAVMACFEAGIGGESEVLAALRADLGDADAELPDTVAALVEQFHRLGWLEPIIP